ncbi:MAG: hypothetical protein ACK58N_07070 [Synechocystis sp.]|jgi:hypothetical protein
MKMVEIRKQGYRALRESLGVVGMLRFLQQFEASHGDYTQYRHGQNEPTMAEFKEFIHH